MTLAGLQALVLRCSSAALWPSALLGLLAAASVILTFEASWRAERTLLRQTVDVLLVFTLLGVIALGAITVPRWHRASDSAPFSSFIVAIIISRVFFPVLKVRRLVAARGGSRSDPGYGVAVSCRLSGRPTACSTTPGFYEEARSEQGPSQSAAGKMEGPEQQRFLRILSAHIRNQNLLANAVVILSLIGLLVLVGGKTGAAFAYLRRGTRLDSAHGWEDGATDTDRGLLPWAPAGCARTGEVVLSQHREQLQLLVALGTWWGGEDEQRL